MPAPTITPLPTPPSRSQSPDTFSTDADAFLGALPDFASDANAQASYLDGLAAAVDADAAAADADAAAAAASEAAAAASEAAAALSETNAAASEAAAAASEAAAAISESNAAASEAAAAASAAEAEAVVAGIGFQDIVFINSSMSPYSITSATNGKLIACDTSGGNIVINLPAISGLTLPFTTGAKKTTSDGNTVTINCTGGNTFDDGTTSKSVNVPAGFTLIPDTDTNPDVWAAIGFGGATAGPVTGSGLTMSTDKLLGRNTAGTGAIEEIAHATLAEMQAGTETALRGMSPANISQAITALGVVGPASATANGIALYDGTTGKLLKSGLNNGTAGQALLSGGNGNAPAWGTISAGTKEFTSSGSITAGQAVSINSNGTVSATTGVSQSATFNFAYYFGSGAYRSFGSYFDASTGWHFAGYMSGGGTVYLLSYQINSSGAVINVNTSSIGTGNYTRGVIFKDTTANRIIFVVGGGSPTTLQMNAFSVNTSTGALTLSGGIAPFDTGYNPGGFDAYFDSYANRTVLVRYSGSGSHYVYAYQFTGSGFSQTATDNFTGYNTNSGAIACAFDTSRNQGMVFFCSSTGSYCGRRSITLNAAGNAITLGTENVGTPSAGFTNFAHAEYFPSIDRYVVQHAVTSGYAYTYLFTASTGGYVSLTSTVPNSSVYYSWANYGFSNSFDTVNNVVYCVGNNYSGGQLWTWAYTVTASGFTYVNGSSYTSLNFAHGTAYTYDYTQARAGIVAYEANTGFEYIIGHLPAYFSTTADKFVGFSTQSVSTGQAVTVTVLGGINTNQSSLTTGSNYYLQLNGSLSTTPSAYGIVAKALSATSAQVVTGGAFKKLISQTVISGSPSAITITLPAGFSQFEITFQYVRGDSSSSPIITGSSSAGSSITFNGRGWFIYGGSSWNYYTQSSTNLYLTGNLTHSAGQVFGGSILLQSSASGPYWAYQMMTSFYNGNDGYFNGAGYFNDKPSTITISGFNVFSDNGVITLYGIG